MIPLAKAAPSVGLCNSWALIPSSKNFESDTSSGSPFRLLVFTRKSLARQRGGLGSKGCKTILLSNGSPGTVDQWSNTPWLKACPWVKVLRSVSNPKLSSTGRKALTLKRGEPGIGLSCTMCPRLFVRTGWTAFTMSPGHWIWSRYHGSMRRGEAVNKAEWTVFLAVGIIWPPPRWIALTRSNNEELSVYSFMNTWENWFFNHLLTFVWQRNIENFKLGWTHRLLAQRTFSCCPLKTLNYAGLARYQLGLVHFTRQSIVHKNICSVRGGASKCPNWPGWQ